MPSSAAHKRSRPVFKTAAFDDQEKFQPLPQPTGKFPYHLNILDVLPGLPANKIVFHMAGDTGGLVSPVFKHRVANEMISQCNADAVGEDRPQFFFHLGDVVYNFGQEEEYYPQFFEPYRNYPNPIFAIAGNHDADVDPFDENEPNSLDAFVKVFCDTASKSIPFSGDSGRKSNIQPNVYYVLKTPLANIIALYSNVPRFGTITPEQKEWFINELIAANTTRSGKALIVCLHHSAYSADTNHGSSLHMQVFLNAAFSEAGVWPDVVFSGHVHNYQRFSKQYPNGKTVPFIIAGAGGYAELHKIAQPGDPAFPDQSNLLDNVYLEKYCDDSHGFLKITIEKTTADFTLKGDYYAADDSGTGLAAAIYDSFTIKLG
ncbi:metallophosphoesterase [Mucilaginibacter sp.]|uniref:metallophosphoesterase family protein n=1 Tax=Mucilaginibacter sp. TaxID=1882438 RepID=UPI00283F81A8|nr:metallophosphoesterase [Mucilaginibacter sp.]MDR3693814.1 metallophosphoesterase [Mucilaginibacter sp.]